MNRKSYGWKAALMLAITLIWSMCMPSGAAGASNDNSLASLGILTEGAEVSPEFEYGRTEYEVAVPAGTQRLDLEPIPSHGNAWIVDIAGTELVDGETTVTITVSAENGEQYPYYLHVKASEASAGEAAVSPETEVQTEAERQPETERETEDPRFVKVNRNALEEAENTIKALKTETNGYRDRTRVLMSILYGLIALSVVLLFVVINLILKKKDLKTELNEYRGYGYSQQEPSGYANGQDYGGQAYYEQGGTWQQEEPDQGQVKEDPQKAGRKKAPSPVKDDPETVPKPSKAKKKMKQMPEYEQPPKEAAYQQPAENKNSDKDVEVTMIDL